MSLDVYLELKGGSLKVGDRIFIREDGQNKEISRAEWDERFPGRQPVIARFDKESDEVFSANITHNLGGTAEKAGLYKALWRPEEIGVKHAADLVNLLNAGLHLLKSNPDYFRKFNPENGWGTYEGLVNFVEKYLEACKEYPDADVSVSR